MAILPNWWYKQPIREAYSLDFASAARATGESLETIRGFWWFLKSVAAEAEELGTISGFNVEGYCYIHGCTPEQIEARLEAFKEAKLLAGDGRIAGFAELQATRGKDAERAERKRAHDREAKQAKRAAAKAAKEAQPAPKPAGRGRGAPAPSPEALNPSPRPSAGKNAPACMPPQTQEQEPRSGCSAPGGAGAPAPSCAPCGPAAPTPASLEADARRLTSYMGMQGGKLAAFWAAWDAFRSVKKGAFHAAAKAYGAIQDWDEGLGRLIAAQAARYTAPEAVEARNGCVAAFSRWLADGRWTENYEAAKSAARPECAQHPGAGTPSLDDRIRKSNETAGKSASRSVVDAQMEMLFGSACQPGAAQAAGVQTVDVQIVPIPREERNDAEARAS